MSQEFQLAHSCPHLTIEEPVDLDTDRRGLLTRQPVGSTGTVRVLANDEFYIPPGGLLSAAQITASKSGPYNIDACHDKTLTVQSSQEAVSVTLPSGLRVKTDQIVEALTPHMSDILVENVRGRLVFTDTATVGPASRIRIGGDVAEALGFASQYGARGRVVYPGWRLEKREDDILNRFPRFVRSVRQPTSFKVTYTVPAERCRRCRATFVENDYRFTIQGEPILIQDEDLLYQAAMKILLTRKGSNPFHPFYGSQVTSRIGTKAVGAVVTLLNEDVRTALASMQTLQAGQAKYQRVSQRERLFNIRSVEVLRHEDDPTVFMVEVVVSNASGEPIQLSIVFTTPGVVALTGSNGQSLGLEAVGLDSNDHTRLLR